MMEIVRARVTEIVWIDCRVQLPIDGQIVVVHGGVAQYRGRCFFTGMESPQYMRPINWHVTHWAYISELNPDRGSAEADTQLPSEVTSVPMRDPEDLCEGCPWVGYPTDKTRCAPCPRRVTQEPETPFDNERADMKYREDMKDAGRGHLLR